MFSRLAMSFPLLTEWTLATPASGDLSKKSGLKSDRMAGIQSLGIKLWKNFQIPWSTF